MQNYISSIPEPNFTDIPLSTSDDLHTELIMMRAKRGVDKNIFNSENRVQENQEKPMDFANTVPMDFENFSDPVKHTDEIDLDFTTGPSALPVYIPNIDEFHRPTRAGKNNSIISHQISANSINYAKKQINNIRLLLGYDAQLASRIPEEAILKTIAIMHNQEEHWDKLSMNQITVQKVEILLWQSFTQIFSQLKAEKYLNHPFEKGDIFELKIPGFEMFNITRIRQEHKESFAVCLVQSKRKSSEQSHTSELLVRLPIRIGGQLELYRNQANGREFIHSLKIEDVVRKRPKNTGALKSLGNKSGIFGILGLESE